MKNTTEKPIMSNSNATYFVPDYSVWPIVGSIALFCLLFGTAGWLHNMAFAPYLTMIGAATLIVMTFGWFGSVIKESLSGHYNKQVDVSFRWGMIWFIVSEIFFFGAFFGALFYARMFSVPWLGGEGHSDLTHLLLWPQFQATWPALSNPDNSLFEPAKNVIATWDIPFLNTVILLSSGATITWAHWALLKNKRAQLILGLGITVLLGLTFLGFQFYEYHEAYEDLNLKLSSGIYGTTFFMLTGFHGLHVTIGSLILLVLWIRCLRGHFTKDNHFAFEAGAWYWHFVDVVWLGLFIFVYWL
jgi:cytochrome c oxidase subunit 3